MDKKLTFKKVAVVLLMAVAYLATFILGASSGIIHPACYAYAGAVLPLHWWTDTEGSLAAAVEEMPAGYDQLMQPVIDNIPMLVVVLVLTVPIAVLSMQLAERVMKKRTGALK